MTNSKILEQANARPIKLVIEGVPYPAKLYGNKLQSPCMVASNTNVEINWKQANLLATGIITEIHY